MTKSLTVLVSILFLGLAYPAFSQDEADLAYDFPPGEKGLEEMILFLLDATDKERKAFSKSLMPKPEDYDAVFEPEFAKRVSRYHKRLRRQIDVIVRPHRKNQTAYLFWVTNTEELNAYTGEARNFPGGYKEIAGQFKPGLTMYRFKFIKPGMRLGSSYDVMIHVNGHWRLFPRPWVMSDELARY